MKKFSLLLLSMAMSLAASANVGDVVTDLSQISPTKAYTIESGRCYLYYSEEVAGNVLTSTANSYVAPEQDAEDINQWFAFEPCDGGYYLFSVGAGKYIDQTGAFVDEPTDVTYISESSAANGDHMWYFQIGSNGFNTQISDQYPETGYVLNSWTIADEGNTFMITEAADLSSADIDPEVAAALGALDELVDMAGETGFPKADAASVVAAKALINNPTEATLEAIEAAGEALFAEDDIVVPADGKKYIIAIKTGEDTGVMKQLNADGTEIELVDAEIDLDEGIPAAAVFTAHVDDNGTYFTASNGKVLRMYGTSVANASNTGYWLKDATTTGLDDEVSELAYLQIYNLRQGTSDELLNQVAWENEDLYGCTYIYGARGTQDGAIKYGAEVYKYTAGVFDGADRPFANANFTSAIMFLDVTGDIDEGDDDDKTPTWTKVAHNANMEGWSDALLAPNSVTDVVVEYYASENKIVAKEAMGDGTNDLTIVLDDDSNIVSINGETPDPSYGDIGFYTGHSDYYYAYVDPAYDSYVNLDPENGYITLSGWWYDSSDNYSWGYYSLTWAEIQEPEPAAFAPEAGQAYYVMLVGTELGLDFENLVSDYDQSGSGICVSSTPSKLYFNEVEGGWTLNNNEDLFMAPCTWSGYAYWSTVVAEDAYTWTIEGTDGEFSFIRQDGKFVNVDNVNDGANVYCDKGSAGTFYLVPTEGEWNGVVRIADEVADLDELLDFNVEFCYAGSVEVANMGLLAAIFDESGDPFAIAMAGDNYSQFGSVVVNGDVATVKFAKIADLREDLKKSAVAKIAGYNNGAAGFAYVYICGKSFKVDGTVYEEAIDNIYVAAGSGEPTGINSIAIDSKASVYDLTGRRVNNTAKGQIYIQNNQKVRK